MCGASLGAQPSVVRRRVGIEAIEDVISRSRLSLRWYGQVNRNEYNILLINIPNRFSLFSSVGNYNCHQSL